MTLRRRLVDWGLAIALLAVPVLLLRASLRQPQELGAVDQAVLRVSAPLQAAVAWVVDGVGGAWTRYVALVDVEEENRELRADNERLRRELATATRRAIDIATLEDMLALRASIAADTIGARVIAAAMSPSYRVLRIRIDRGEPEMKVGLPVITSAGLVGRILRVYGGHADVLLITDVASSVPVMVKRTGVRGSVRGQGRDDGYHATLEQVEVSDVPDAPRPVEAGDVLVTSGLGDFPAGIEVAEVVEVVERDYGMFQEVLVRPTVDFAALRGVSVLVASPPPPDPDAGRRRRSEPAFGLEPF